MVVTPGQEFFINHDALSPFWESLNQFPVSRIVELEIAIELCIRNRRIAPALILIYATMDILASLDRDKGHKYGQRSDFVDWVDRYVIPNLNSSCTALDLYAARCALLHSYSAESRLSREGEANPIYYAWGDAQEQKLQRSIEAVGDEPAKAVHVDNLFAALRAGIAQFIAEVEQDPARAVLIAGRANLFLNMPKAPLDWF